MNKTRKKFITAKLFDSLPYLDAVVYETLRKSSFAAYGVPHQLIEDLVYQGFILP